MASDPEFVRFVCEQLRGAGAVSSKRMFGEAAVYLDDKVVGLVCDNQLFVKPTSAGREKIGTPTEAPPFTGASNWFLMTDLDDPEFLADVVRATAAALPPPKIKKKQPARPKAPPQRAKAKRAKAKRAKAKRAIAKRKSPRAR